VTSAVVGIFSLLALLAFFVVDTRITYAAGNLVPNGNLETPSSTSSSTPAGWSSDSWGTMTVTFTYPVPGMGGGSAAQVAITKYTSGDAKWYFNNIPVTAGTTYQLSDNYSSNVVTEVDVDFHLSNGTESYLWIANPATTTAGAWGSFSGQVTAPSNAVSMTVLHLLQSVGTLTIDNMSVTSGTAPPPAPTCTLTASPTSIQAGQSSTLAWTSQNASTTSITGLGSVAVSGSASVSPTATTTYTGTFAGAGGTTTCAAIVDVIVPQAPPPTISSFTANPQTIPTGNSSTLSWSVNGATSLTIDQGIGTVLGTSSEVVSPTATTTYTLTASNANGTTTATAVVAVIVSQPPPPPTNLIPNANFAAGTTNNPTGWNADYWGSLKTKFTYPVTGADGTTSKAAQIVVTAYKSGDADWDFNPVSVTPGQIYTFTDKYMATVETEIDVQYVVVKADTIAGECSPDSNASYVDCAEVISSAVPVSSSFTAFSGVISPPAGTVSMTVLHMLISNGTLAVTDYSLTPGVDPALIYPQGIVSLTFDDGYLDHYTNALPILQSASGGALHGTFYMIPDDTVDKTQTGYMTIAQMLQMQTAGNDMASHTADHCDLVALYNNPKSATDGGRPSGVAGTPGIGCPDHALKAATTSQAEITNSKIELQGFGASPDNNLAYPFGSYNNAVEQQVKNGGFLAARTIDVGYNTKATNPYALVVQDLDDTTTVATVQSWIDTAMANKVWLILVFHQIESNPANFNDSYAETPITLQGIVNYLAQKHTCVLTVGQVVSNKTSCP
jgi:peptidoglycan/xylan/chitin deacetylase (PgdA/CDA1 family)